MKLGAENKTKSIAALALLVIGVVLLVRALGGFGGAAPAAAPAAGRAARATPAATAAPKRERDRDRHVAAVLTPSLDPRLRLDLLKDSESVEYRGKGRNIFLPSAEPIPQPVAPGLTAQKNSNPVPTGPPPPPPINLKFYGWASKSGEARAIFLAQGDNVFIAHEGDIIARRYRVVRIGNSTVEIEDVLSNNRQSIPLVQG